MSDKIAEIRARHEAGPRGMLPMQALAVADDDRATLLAEVDQQRAEIERLRDTNKQLVSGIYTIACIKDEEIELLREENKRLREALEGKP